MVSIVLLVVGLLPASRLKNALMSLLGRRWSVDRTARIHPVVLWRVDRLEVGRHCRIGPLNVLRDLAAVRLAEDSVIGQFNWVTAEARYAEQANPDLAGSLVLEHGAALASRHYVDCAGGVRLDHMSIVAGVRSTLLTHWADHRNWVLRAAPVEIGAWTIVSSGSTVTAGATLPERCVVAAGAVVPKSLPQSNTLYAGVPAKPIGDLTGSAHAARTEPRFARGTPVETPPEPSPDAVDPAPHPSR